LTLEAAAALEFAQAVRAVTGLRPANSDRHLDAVMDDLVSAHASRWLEVVRNGRARLHRYAKADAPP
jgi:phosphoribosylaminoimidazole carboxylase (NCAIR synthetase)